MSEGLQAPRVGMREVRLTIPAKAEYVLLGRLALSGITRMRPLADETAERSQARRHRGVHQLGAPRVRRQRRHASTSSTSSTTTGSWSRSPTTARGFDPDEVEESGELTEGGLGIAIIRALVDEFEVGERADGRGSRLRFVKFLTA